MITKNLKKQKKHIIRSFLNISLILIIGFTVLLGNVLGQEEVRVFITGPDSLPTNATVEYIIRIIGGPAESLGENESANWSFEAQLEMPTPAGAKILPINGSSKVNIFSINVTAPPDARDITLEVNGSSSNGTTSDYSGTIIKEIDIFRPITVNITAVVRNPTEINVNGAVITFNVDGDVLGNLTENILANTTKEVYWEWVTSKDDKGAHDVEVTINEDGRILEFEDGDNVMRKTIYIGERPAREMRLIMIFNSGLVLIIEIIAIFFVFGAYLMRRNTIRGRGYYSPRSTYSMFFFGILFIALSIPVFSVSQILVDNPDVGDATSRLIDGVLIFILGFVTIMLTWDRSRKKGK